MPDATQPDADDLAVLRATDMVTSRFTGFTWDMGVPVQIASRPPRWWRREQHAMLEKVPELAPDRSTWKLPHGAYHAAYIRRLETHVRTTFGKLAEIARVHPGERLCLLCYEELPKDCHRSEFSEWANELYGLVIPELDRNTAAASSGMIRPASQKRSGPRRTGATAAAAQANRAGRTLDEKFEAATPAVREVRAGLEEVAPLLGLKPVSAAASLQWHDDHGPLANLYPTYAIIEFPFGRLRRVGTPEEVDAVRGEMQRIHPGRNLAEKFPSVGCSQVLQHWSDFATLLSDIKRIRSGNQSDV
jgi:hypothetical protein